MSLLEAEEMLSVNKRYNQYADYSNLPKLLKRYSFDEKMRIAYQNSICSIDFSKKMKERKAVDIPLPWCLETFVMLSMEAKEYTDGNFIGKNQRHFNQIMNTIWATTAKVTSASCGKYSCIEWLFPLIALTQFELQENDWVYLYRYWWVFTNETEFLNMKQIFRDYFGTEYLDFLLLGYTLQVLCYAQDRNSIAKLPDGLLEYLLLNRFPTASKMLSITRDRYIQMQKKLINASSDPIDYIYSIRPSYQYAFILDRHKLYFPLPHLLKKNITASLLYRLTEDNNHLRQQIGVGIWEPYLLEIIQGAKVYSEVFSEQKYFLNGSNSKSPDVLARQGQSVLFLESKSTVPSSEIRLLKDAAFDKNVDRVAKHIAQLYRQIYRFERYNPFYGSVSQSPDDYWGIVVVLEDTYINRRFYHEKACEVLNIETGSCEWTWITKHIRVASLYDIENACFTGRSLIEICKEAASLSETDRMFTGLPLKPKPIKYSKLLQFKEMVDTEFKRLLSEMKDNGIIT